MQNSVMNTHTQCAIIKIDRYINSFKLAMKSINWSILNEEPSTETTKKLNQNRFKFMKSCMKSRWTRWISEYTEYALKWIFNLLSMWTQKGKKRRRRRRRTEFVNESFFPCSANFNFTALSDFVTSIWTLAGWNSRSEYEIWNGRERNK